MSDTYTVHMPDIGEGVVEGEVVSWLKQVGDHLNQDEPVVVVMTDKATVELPSPYPGKLAKQYIKVGEIAVKDKPLYDIALENPLNVKAAEKSSETPKKTKVDAPLAKVLHGEKALAAPVVRKLAKEMGINLDSIQGSGPEGRVTREDLQKGKTSSLQQDDEEVPLVGIRNLMAKKMALSKKNIPHFSFFDRVDASRLMDFYSKMKNDAEERHIKLTLMPFFIKALSKCLIEHPLANSSLDAEKNSIILHKRQNIGIAMSTSFGLIVPVLKNVQQMSLFEVIFTYDQLKEKAKKNQLSSQEMQDGTITLTNFGALGDSGVFATPIINFPESAILGVAHIRNEPAIFHDEVKVRSILNCSWSFDHRIIDGDEATKISYTFKKFIENPAQLLDDSRS